MPYLQTKMKKTHVRDMLTDNQLLSPKVSELPKSRLFSVEVEIFTRCLPKNILSYANVFEIAYC